MSQPQPLPLSWLLGQINDQLDAAFGNEEYWILAEVSDFSYHQGSGHRYFNLVERNERGIVTNSIGATAWKSYDRHIREFEAVTGAAFKTGLKAMVCVEVRYHPVYGLKLNLLDIDPAYTIGQQMAKREQNLQYLLENHPEAVWMEDGQIVTPNRELSLPVVVQRLAIVAAKHSAGYEDLIHTLGANAYNFHFHITLFDAPMQGDQHAKALVQRFEEVAQQHFDLVLFVRGGGAASDLSLFDEASLALAVASCPWPVWTGIGHQRDLSLADLMAHTSLKTPTQVAEAVIDYNLSFLSQVLSTASRARGAAKLQIQQAQQQLANGLGRAQRQALEQLQHQRSGLTNLVVRSQQGLKRQIAEQQQSMRYLELSSRQMAKQQIALAKESLVGYEQLTKLVSHERVLAWGYAKLSPLQAHYQVGQELTIESKFGTSRIKMSPI